MTDLPYTYTDPRTGSEIFVYRGGFLDMKGRDGDAVTVGLDSPDRAVALAESVLATGVTGWHVLSDEAVTDAERAAARSMRERAAEAALDDPTADYDIARQIRALPLLPDDTEGARTMRHCVLCASGDHQPSAHDDDTPVYESPQDLVQEIERLRAALKTAEADRDRQLSENATAYSEGVEDMREAATAAAREAAGDDVARAVQRAQIGDRPDLGRRVGALEQQFTDLAALVHGHGEDLARIRYRFTAEDDG